MTDEVGGAVLLSSSATAHPLAPTGEGPRTCAGAAGSFIDEASPSVTSDPPGTVAEAEEDEGAGPWLWTPEEGGLEGPGAVVGSGKAAGEALDTIG